MARAMIAAILATTLSAQAFELADRSDLLAPPLVHDDGRDAQLRRIVDTAGSGVAVDDFNNDGWDDVVVLGGVGGVAVYQNRQGAFAQTQVIDVDGIALGICVADVNNDGFADALVTTYGQDSLLMNQGDGSFAATTPDALAGFSFGTSCAWADVDADGDLDVYIARYARIPVPEPRCGAADKNLALVCAPARYHGAADALLINQGGGQFVDEADVRGVTTERGDRGFGVVALDFDQDGDVDIFVANDGGDNRLYVNDGGGRFLDEALLRGLAVNLEGKPEAGMGIATPDLDGDGRLELFLTHFAAETNTLYAPEQGGFYADRSAATGLGPGSLTDVGWGAVAIDLDNDAQVEIVVANGHVDERIEVIQSMTSYAQENVAFVADGRGIFARRPLPGVLASSRGLAWGDFNRDGAVDLIFTHIQRAPTLLLNRGDVGNWVAVAVKDDDHRDAVGTRLTLRFGERFQRTTVTAGGSFMSHSPRRYHFGLGDYSGPVVIHATFPDGRHAEVAGEVNRLLTLQRPPAEQ